MHSAKIRCSAECIEEGISSTRHQISMDKGCKHKTLSNSTALLSKVESCPPTPTPPHLSPPRDLQGPQLSQVGPEGVPRERGSKCTGEVWLLMALPCSVNLPPLPANLIPGHSCQAHPLCFQHAFNIFGLIPTALQAFMLFAGPKACIDGKCTCCSATSTKASNELCHIIIISWS